MKFLVVGLGSMGKRRIRLLKNNYKDIEIIGIDSNSERTNEVRKVFNIDTYNNLEICIKNEEIDAGFVCTSPKYHSEIILKLLKNNINIFTEINLIDNNYDEIIDLANKKNIKLFLSSTFLYRKEINFIREKANKENNITYRYHTGQYLPDWHPWESYKDFFVSDKLTNACREIFAIELPWIVDAFGEVEKIFTVKNKVSSLDVDYSDNYSVILRHKNGNVGTLNLDIVSRKPTRNFEMYNENIHLFWNGTPNSLNYYDLGKKNIVNINLYESIEKDKKYSDNIIENAYLEEINAFIKFLNGDKSFVKYSFEKDKYILSLIDKIEGDN